MLKSLFCLAAVASSGLAATVRYDWNIEWVNRSPDGFPRPVIGINGQWPLPSIEATVGDLVIVNINNLLGNESTGLHFHGIHQIDTNHMDGAAGATQCPVPPGSSFTYKFHVEKSGTYWYHSHTGTQYPDGLRGPLIVKDLVDPYAGQYDEEYLLTLSDWYHAEVPTLLNEMFQTTNVRTRPPTPLAGLINDAANNVAQQSFKFVPGKRYKFRIINMSALTGVFLFFDEHPIKVIEVDGVYLQPTEGEQLYITPAQRYSIIIEAKPSATRNYAFSAVFDMNPTFENPVVGYPLNATGSLQYDEAEPFPEPIRVSEFNTVDDFSLQPLVELPLGAPDVQIVIDFTMGLDSNGLPRAFVNGKPYIHQEVPTLYTALSTGEDALNPIVYGEVNPFIIKTGQVVEIVANNLHTAHHPFHLHGHHFHVCSRPGTGAGQASLETECSPTPLVRDVVTIHARSSAVLRFKADNPGVWLFHCHIEWHVPMGLTATIIEDPEEIQKTIQVPEQHFDVCRAGCHDFQGNAGGNTEDHFDLSNANNEPTNEANG